MTTAKRIMVYMVIVSAGQPYTLTIDTGSLNGHSCTLHQHRYHRRRAAQNATAYEMRSNAASTSLRRMHEYKRDIPHMTSTRTTMWSMASIIVSGSTPSIPREHWRAQIPGSALRSEHVRGNHLFLRGNHLSNTTGLTQVFFKSGEQRSKWWWSLRRRKTRKTNEAALDKYL